MMDESHKNPYLAGIFDGEGTIFASTTKTGGRRVASQVFVSMSITHLPTLAMFQQTFGGQLYEVKKIPGRKTRWNWNLNVRKLQIAFMQAVQPYLREKLAQLDAALAYLLAREDRPEKKMPLDLVQWGQRLRDELREAKKFEFGGASLLFDKEVQPTPELTAYFSGWFDAEGCIYARFRTDREATLPKIEISLGNAFLPTLKELQACFGGRLYSVKTKPGIKSFFNWTLGDAASQLRFLEAIRPNLKEKRSQAELAIAFLSARMQLIKLGGSLSDALKKDKLG
jgi:hypothetical protein